MEHQLTQKLIVVSGAPGAGKTTIAEPLAATLGFALISKDHIKEILYESLKGTPGDIAFSRQIGSAAMELMWSLALRTPQAMLDANFRPHSEYEQRRLRSFSCPVVEIYCTCPPEEVKRRFEERASTSRHHPAHPFTEFPTQWFVEYDRPMGVGPVIEVDVTRTVDIAEIARKVETLWDISR